MSVKRDCRLLHECVVSGLRKKLKLVSDFGKSGKSTTYEESHETPSQSVPEADNRNSNISITN
jgi:hypothetical protein